MHTNWRIMPFGPKGSKAIQTRATLWAIFEKFPLIPPLNVFRKCGFFGDHAKNCHNLAIRALFEPLFALKSCPVFALLAHTNWRIKPFPQDSSWAFQRRATFWAFLRNFHWSPFCTFSENAGFGWPCKNCHNLAIRVLLEPLLVPKSSPVFAL